MKSEEVAIQITNNQVIEERDKEGKHVDNSRPKETRGPILE